MADAHDPRLEASLRAALRADADAVPFRLRASDLEGRLAARRRAAGRRRLAFAAALAVVGIGLSAVALSFVRLDGQVATSPSVPSSVPSSVPAASSSARPPSFGSATDAIVVRLDGPEGDPTTIVVEAWTVQAVEGSGLTAARRTLSRIPVADLGATRIEPYDGVKASTTGRLAFALDTGDAPAQTLVVDMVNPLGRGRVTVDAPLAAVLFGPDGRMAADLGGGVVGFWDAKGERLPDGRLGSAEMLSTWAADGTGVMVAWRDGSDTATYGVVAPGEESAPREVPPARAQLTGLERPYDADGYSISVGCASSGEHSGVGCALVRLRGEEPVKPWGGLARDAGVADQVWGPAGIAWVLQTDADGFRIVAAGESSSTEIARIPVEGATGDFPRFSGVRDADAANPRFVVSAGIDAAWLVVAGGFVQLPAGSIFAGWAGVGDPFPSP